MVSRPAQNWNQEFTFDGELAEISGVQNRGIPLFLFFPRSTLAVYIGVTRLIRARSLVPARAHEARGDEENKEKEGHQDRNSISSSSWRLSRRCCALYCQCLDMYIYISIHFLLCIDNFPILARNIVTTFYRYYSIAPISSTWNCNTDGRKNVS